MSDNNFYITLWSVLLAIVLSIILTRVKYELSYYKPTNKIKELLFSLLKPEQDIFLEKCIKWENDLVIVSLKNLKVYIGVLLQYTENTQLKLESQMISIIPVRSGGREQQDKKVNWSKEYLNKKNVEVIIPRSEIITFGKFDKDIYEHFNKKDNKDDQA